MSSAHLDEWQRRSFDISSGTCTPEQMADAYRAHILSIQYAWASAELSPAGAASLLRTYSESYAAVLDSDDPRRGLNNYAESALHLARNQKNHSDKWESSITIENVFNLPYVQRMMKTCAVPVDPSDVNITVGGEVSGGGEKGSAFSGPSSGLKRELLSHRLVVPPPRAEMGRGDSNPLSGAVEWARGCEGAPLHPPLAQNAPRAPTGSTPIFSHNNFNSTGNDSSSLGYTSGPNVYNQSVFFSSTNPSKRKNFYSSGTESNRSSFPSHGEQEPRGGGRRGEGVGTNFRTAREQFIVDQQKKHSHQGQRASAANIATSTKKCLGANRSRGAFSKFVSPMPKQEESNSKDNPPEDAQSVDERLKNFEPKIIELIMSEIMDHGPPVAWDDIAGLEFAKATIKEIVVWPMLRPDIFTGLRGPPKGILLFGPPGTGKTLIGKCIACQSGATFFSISASSLTSKWVGEGEKMVRALFAIAHCHQPAVIFIDEIDSLLSQRTDGEHDSSRRIKTEFLVQLDGAATSADDRILVVGATNRPQEIDEAARRRLAKRLYIPLPEAEARRQIVTNLMSREKSQLETDEMEKVVKGTEGFSGADMTQLCREAALGPIRSICLSDIATITADQVRPILHSDFQEALKTVRPSVSSKDLELYEEWNKTFGCGR
ncbi:fidgetin-like protein 1 [Xyrauchen texanus]|uniref:fidgetin-like protein 1 n=1 Tax=Xyrauchen texanus TaxID=154827 RepID=UPI00224289F2|nr:fidgetin-like protein 1 [Xyrauchen texanus]XP_051946263.1 fidgetin-like protein 1 [Xyrauchen texanus]